MPDINQLFNSEKKAYQTCMNVYIEFIKKGSEFFFTNSFTNILLIPFKDYNTWTWIEPVIMLQSRLSNDFGFKGACKEKILSILSIGNEIQVAVKKAVFQRVLKGEELHLGLIKEAHNIKNKDLEIESSIKTIMQLVTIIEFGGSIEFTVEKAEALLFELIQQTKKLV